MSYFVYILRSDQSDRYYVGSSEDAGKRLLRHNAGATPSTKPFRPWRIVYIETHVSKAEALKRELYIKKMKSRNYIQTLIQRGSFPSTRELERPD